MPSEPERGKRLTFSQRLEWLCLFGILGLLVFRVVNVQLYPDPRTLSQLTGQYRQTVRRSLDRATVYDRSGAPLAMSVPAWSVFLDPGVEGWDGSRLKQLAPFLDKKMLSQLSKPLTKRFYWLKRYLTEEQAEEIRQAGGKGVFVRSERKRVYPKGKIFSHLLGFCDNDSWGLSGIELTWNNVLYIPERSLVNYRGARPLSEPTEEDPTQEQGLYLTVDSQVQYALEEFLGQAAVQNKVKWAAAVCLHSSTGEVLGMASWPSFDPNVRSTFLHPEALRNNVISRVYEPGSTFKPIMVGIALENGAIKTNSAFRCTARIQIADAVMSDATPKDNGTLSVDQILEKSSNVGIAQIGMRCDPYKTHSDMKNWGIERQTGIMLSGEESGLLRSPEQWYGVIPANVAIGQGFALTPLQLVTAFNAIVNGGVLMRPFIVQRAVDAQGNEVVLQKPQEITRVLSSRTARWLRTVLRQVVTQGTGKRANSSLVPIAAKTGTAQVADKGVYVKGRYNASMIGFWPSDRPEYTMLIVLGDVTGQRYYGGQIVAPVFKNIVEEIMRLKGQI